MFGNLAKMMKLASEVKTRLPELRQKLNETFYSAQSSDGGVKATVNGRFMLTELVIEPELLQKVTAQDLSEMVKSAVNAACEKAATAAQEAMKELTGGMEIPGLEF